MLVRLGNNRIDRIYKGTELFHEVVENSGDNGEEFVTTMVAERYVDGDYTYLGFYSSGDFNKGSMENQYGLAKSYRCFGMETRTDKGGLNIYIDTDNPSVEDFLNEFGEKESLILRCDDEEIVLNIKEDVPYYNHEYSSFFYSLNMTYDECDKFDKWEGKVISIYKGKKKSSSNLLEMLATDLRFYYWQKNSYVGHNSTGYFGNTWIASDDYEMSEIYIRRDTKVVFINFKISESELTDSISAVGNNIINSLKYGNKTVLVFKFGNTACRVKLGRAGGMDKQSLYFSCTIIEGESVFFDLVKEYFYDNRKGIELYIEEQVKVGYDYQLTVGQSYSDVGFVKDNYGELSPLGYGNEELSYMVFAEKSLLMGCGYTASYPPFTTLLTIGVEGYGDVTLKFSNYIYSQGEYLAQYTSPSDLWNYIYSNINSTIGINIY